MPDDDDRTSFEALTTIRFVDEERDLQVVDDPAAVRADQHIRDPVQSLRLHTTGRAKGHEWSQSSLVVVPTADLFGLAIAPHLHELPPEEDHRDQRRCGPECLPECPDCIPSGP